MKLEKLKNISPRLSEMENVLLPIRNKETGRVDLSNSLLMAITSPQVEIVKSNILVAPNAKEILVVTPSKWTRMQGLLISLEFIRVKQEEVLQIEIVNVSGRMIRIQKGTVLAHITDITSKPEKNKKIDGVDTADNDTADNDNDDKDDDK